MIRPDGTVSDDITTTIKPADRVPSIGVQLTIETPEYDRSLHGSLCRVRRDAGADLRACHRCGNACTMTPCCACMPAHAHPIMRPERLTLWDQTAPIDW